MDGIRFLAFDTGGTVLDWHAGLVAALAESGARQRIEHDWHDFANEYRRRALTRMTGTVDSGFNIDDVHRAVLDELIRERGLGGLSAEDRESIWRRWHELDCWPDFPEAFSRLKSCYACISFTILSLALVIDVSRRQGICWDAVISCEMLRVYKPRPEAYRSAARLLQADPAEILMVACHNFDLNAARAEGFHTAFVHRPDEWGAAGPPDPVPNPATDIIVDGFAALADRLCAGRSPPGRSR
jgi:2-haloacid dehalogenase